MTKQLVDLEKGKIKEFALQRREQQKAIKYLDYMNDLVDFQETLDEMSKGIEEARSYVKELVEKVDSLEISKEEAEDNFVNFINRYKVTEWSKVIGKLRSK